MQEKSQYKRNHHFDPKFYLKGFTEDERSSFIWVYTKGRPYNPGHKRHHNPCRRPIRRVGVERDHYAFKKRDGTINFDIYEDELERLEKPSNPIFKKLRRCEMITNREKAVFASYVYLMYKRVPKRKERFTKSWPRIFRSVSSRMAKWIDLEESVTDETDSTRLARISKLRSELKGELEYYGEHMPIDTEIPLKSLVMESPLGIPGILSAMAWQFFIAPMGYGFLTGDNPVFSPGINKSYAEVSFPISKDIALVMSWYDIEQGFFITTPEVVNEINRRTVWGAQHEIYYSSAEEWVFEMMAESRDGYYLIYPYPGSLS